MMKPAELERLALLSEEMGEVQQIIGKILRHGYDATHPDGGPTNRELLESELGDVRAAIVLMLERGDISNSAMEQAAKSKYARQFKYLWQQE